MITRTIHIDLFIHEQDLNKVVCTISEGDGPPISKHVFDRSMLYDRVIEPTSNTLRRVVAELLMELEQSRKDKQ